MGLRSQLSVVAADRGGPEVGVTRTVAVGVVFGRLYVGAQ